jgi:hypothetical protein
MSRRTLAIVTGLGAAVLIAALGLVVGLRGPDGQAAPTSSKDDLTTFVAAAAGRSQGAADTRDQIRDLMTNDEFRADAAELRDQHEAAMDAWWDKYGSDPRSDDAVAALEKLRDEQHAAMSALLEKYGVDTSAMEKARKAAEQTREKLETLMSDAGFRKDVNALRDKYEAAMDAWWDKYGDAPRSDAAQEAMTKLRDDAKADAESLLKKYDVELPAGFKGLLGGFMGRGGMMMGPDGLGGHHGGAFGMGDSGGGCGPNSPSPGAAPAATQSL